MINVVTRKISGLLSLLLSFDKKTQGPAEVSVDYNKIHAERAKAFKSEFSGTKCIVIGCNTGKDCSYFVEFGAEAVHGVDVVDDVGKALSIKE